MKGFEPEVFTVDEAAEFARVTPTKIGQWMKDGMKHIRTGAEAGKSGPAGIIILREHLMGWMRTLADNVPKPESPGAARKRGRPKASPSNAPGGKWVS